MSRKTIIYPSLVVEKQNDQQIARKFGAAVKNNLYTPQEIIYLEISEAPQKMFVHINILSTTLVLMN